MTTRMPTILLFRRTNRPTLRVWTAFATLNLAAGAAFAQPVPANTPANTLANAPAAVPAPAADPSADPPGRVARLDYLAGAVTTEPAGAGDWSYAQLNRPLTTGDQLWNDRNARSELHIGSTAVRLGAQTSVTVLDLDDANAQLELAQGTLSTRVRALPAGSAYEIDTPNLALGVNGSGDYRVDVAPDGSGTTVTVRSGSVTVYGANGQIPMAAGQQIRFAGTGLQQAWSNAAPPPDGFDQWAAARDAAEDRSVSARYVSRDLPGYQDLDANGSWRDNPQYGEVWVPNAVPAGWAPYRDGHWVWQAPWGWTWVDDAPWGFAPYHYGRWAYLDNSWAWVPGPLVASAPPVYAPALVGVVGAGDGGPDWSVSLAAGGVAAAGVAWFALGPGEPWHPAWGGWSPRYYERVNRTVVVDDYRRNEVRNTFMNYRVPGAVTAVPAAVFVHGQPVSRFAQRVDARQWHNARLQSGTPGLAPVRGSFGPGVRRADYRPPVALARRPVVATRAPTAPPAWRDGLAQRFAHGGGTVPGAGAPVVRAAAHGAWTAPNLRVVTPRPAATGMAARAPGPAPRAGRPGEPAANGAAPPGAERAQADRPPSIANDAHGVPRPPQFANRPEAAGPGVQPGRAPTALTTPDAARAPEAAQARSTPGPRGPAAAAEAGRPTQFAARPQTPQAAGAAGPHGASMPLPRPPEAPSGSVQQPPPRAQLRPEPAPQAGAQPRAGFRPQAQPQPRPQPQPQPRAEVQPPPQPQPHAQIQPRPQPQPHAEVQPRPRPQPQPHAEFRPPPQPQPQPRPQPHTDFHPPAQTQPHPAAHDENADHGRNEHHG